MQALAHKLFEVPGAKPLPEERRQPDLDVKTHGNEHIAFAIKDVDSVAEQLRARGADVFWVRRDPHGANIFIRDNSGNLIEFVQEPDMFS